MFRRKSVLAQGLCEEKSVYECLNKLIAAQTRVSEQQLRWARTEENPLFLCLFGRLAELNWMGNELIRQFQDKQTELNRVFRDVEQEERIVDESRKAFLASKTKCLKLQKQLEHSRKKNDTTKVQSLEIELTTQGSLREHLRQSVETQSHKLELYKIDLLKKGLKSQAETYLEIAVSLQALFNAQLQLADLLPHEPPKSTADDDTETRVSEEMKLFLSQVTDSLCLYPPASGGISTKKLSSEAGQSPPYHRRSSADEVPMKTYRKAQHSISQPILVGHNQSSPLEDTAQPPPSEPPILEKEVGVVTSGEYCEIESQGGGQGGGEEHEDDNHLYMQAGTPRSPLLAAHHQPGCTTNNASTHDDGEEKQTNGDVPNKLASDALPNKSRESVTNAESLSTGGASHSSAEDLINEREREAVSCGTPHSGTTTASDECYADPIDAINEFLQSNDGGIIMSMFGDSPTQKQPPEFNPDKSLLMKSVSEERFPVQQVSKELQLQQFHERLFKDSLSSATSENGESAGNGRRARNSHDYSEIEEEPTYSNPFDALNENECRLFRIKAKNQLKSLSTNAIQQSGSARSNSPPPPPLPAKDDRVSVLTRRPVRYTRGGGNGESEGWVTAPVGNPSTAITTTNTTTTTTTAASPVLLPRQTNNAVWERREPVWKRKNSGRASGGDSSPVSAQRFVGGMSTGGEKPEAPISVAERSRQLCQRSQSDGVPLDEAHLNSRPPMPLPIPERECGAVRDMRDGRRQMNGTNTTTSSSAVVANGGAAAATEGVNGANPSVVDPKNGWRQKAWLERSVSEQYQSAYYARRGRAHVVPLSANEIVKQHISHVAS